MKDALTSTIKRHSKYTLVLPSSGGRMDPILGRCSGM